MSKTTIDGEEFETPHVLRPEHSPTGAQFAITCGGAHEPPLTLLIFLSLGELALRNRSIGDQIARRADAWHWFVRVTPIRVEEFRVEIARCATCRILELTEIAAAIGDVAAALGLPSETPPREVVARARELAQCGFTLALPRSTPQEIAEIGFALGLGPRGSPCDHAHGEPACPFLCWRVALPAPEWRREFLGRFAEECPGEGSDWPPGCVKVKGHLGPHKRRPLQPLPDR